MTAPADPTAPPPLTATQQATLRAFADTVLPRVEGLDPPEFWGVAASDLGADQAKVDSATTLGG